MKTDKIKVGLLVEDLDVYPRESIDSTHVAHIADAIDAGNALPPVIACRKSKRIVDGFHRCRGFRRLFGDDYDVDVVWRDYKTEAELFADAMRLNSAHGNNITPHDRTRCILIGERLGIPENEIADALRITVDRLENIRMTRIGKRRATASNPSGEEVPLKYPVRHMAGQTLTAAQAKVMPDLGGNQQAFYANQLIKLIDAKLLDVNNERLMVRLEELHERLHGVLA